MRVIQFLSDLASSLAIGFATRMAKSIQPRLDNTPINSAARRFGSDVATQLARMLLGESPRLATRQNAGPVHGELLSQDDPPHYSDEQIVTRRLSVWNHPVTLTPKLKAALERYPTK